MSAEETPAAGSELPAAGMAPEEQDPATQEGLAGPADDGAPKKSGDRESFYTAPPEYISVGVPPTLAICTEGSDAH